MIINHTSNIIIPNQPSVADLIEVIESLKAFPNRQATVTISTSQRDYDQKDRVSYGGETTLSVSWTSGT